MEKPEALERGQRWSLMGTEQVIKELDSQGRYISPTSGFTWSRGEFNSSSWSFLGWAPGYGPTPPPLSTPVPAKWEVGQRRRGGIWWADIDPAEHRPIYEGEYTLKERTKDYGGYQWIAISGGGQLFCVAESWPSALIAPSSTSTRTPGAETHRCPACEMPIEVGKIHGCTGASGGGDRNPPQTRRDNKAPAAVPPLTAFQILQARERDRAARRAADAAVLATFVDDWDLLADAPGVVRG